MLLPIFSERAPPNSMKAGNRPLLLNPASTNSCRAALNKPASEERPAHGKPGTAILRLMLAVSINLRYFAVCLKLKMSKIEKYSLPLGLFVSTFITLSLLPVRIAEGQSKDLANLVGSEVVIWLMLLTSWVGINRVFKNQALQNYQKLILSVLVCIVVSILFYTISNPFFEDFPTAPMWRNGILTGLFRLSLRGIFISLVLVPIVYIFVIKQNMEKERLENEFRHLRFIEEQHRILEDVVQQRTSELRDTLKSLEASREQLSHQLYVQSRLIASISHDLVSPLKFKLLTMKGINRMIADGAYEQLPEPALILENALENTYKLVTNLLDIAKIQLKAGPVYSQAIRLADLVSEKAGAFKDIAAAKHITLQTDLNSSVIVNSNSTLVGIVLQNLIDNAVKFSVAGKPVIIRTSITDRGLHLTVRNYSIYLPLQEKPGEKNDGNPPGPENSLSGSEGIGLLLVNEISGLLDIEVKSETEGPWMVFSVCFKEFTTG